MSRSRPFLTCLCGILLSAFQPAMAQLGFDLKVDKPEPYEERVLRAEKSGEKPLKAPGKFFQNLTTHYNYYFNATNKLNDVIEGAKSSFKDDYSMLLPFYNYTLDGTSQNSIQLDSVIYKAQTGIVMHDLRNDWIDNLYLLWGASWYFEKKFDSAALMFQFINYSFAEKEKDGYYKYIGSRMDGNNALTISTKEKTTFPSNMVTPPSRNNAFIWLARTLIELENFAESGSLIVTLRNDPVFPKRLKDDLEEVQAYWFYKQNIWDSAAIHLVQALPQARKKSEQARWEFLAAQMFEKSGNTAEAEKYYTKSIGHTTDPVMEVYARLNLVRINKSGGEHYIDRNIEDLVKMAKRDKYSDYRDIIYFMAAQMEMERKNFPAAQALLLKSAKYNQGNLSSRNRSYKLIADLAWDQKQYLQAASFYDSVQNRDLEGQELVRIENRKNILGKFVGFSTTISHQDSLQRIAAMPEEERTAYITRLVKQLRRQQGLSEDVTTSGGTAINPPTDLFQNSQSKGEWYFYNDNLKSQGLQQFRQVWGTRPNVDNWRRFSDINQQMLAKVPTNTRDANKAADSNIPADNTPSFTSLLNNLPLTDAQLTASNDSVRTALFGLGMLYLNEMEDYPSAIETFEKIRNRFPDAPNMTEVLFYLAFAYQKSGDNARAEAIRKLIQQNDPGSRFATILATGNDPALPGRSSEVTRAYEGIYDLFLSGKFDEAEAAKKKADSLYRTSFWQPQLLYIEAVYQIRQRQDSLAKNTLQTLIGQNADTLLTAKAQNLLEVLGRRNQIEAELSRYQIQRPQEDSVQIEPEARKPLVSRNDSIGSQPKQPVVVNTKPPAPVDTSARKPVVVQQQTNSIYRFDPSLNHYVMIILDKVDPLFANEVKNSFSRYNRDYYPGKTFEMETKDLDADKRLVLIKGFGSAQEAVDFALQAKQRAAREILPWLKADKYSFSVILPANLDILLGNRNLDQYRSFLEKYLPGKF